MATAIQPKTTAAAIGAHHTLVLGFDFTGTSELALDQSLELARALPDVTLHVVWVPQYPLAILEPYTMPVETQALAEHLKDHIAQRALATKTRGSYGKATVAVHVASGDPAHVLTEYAFIEDADLIVVGTHQRTGLERLLLGSVAADVVATAPCPVLIARSKAGDELPRIEPPKRDVDDPSLGRRHTYHVVDRNTQARENAPLLFPLS